MESTGVVEGTLTGRYWTLNGPAEIWLYSRSTNSPRY